MNSDEFDERVVCFVPARSGSSRIHDKNLQDVGGTPLLERAVTTSLTAFGRVYVSTDSATYAAHARAWGATVPSLRPPQLATPTTHIDAVIQHAMAWWSSSPPDTTFVLVQATSPFTTPGDLHDVVDTLRGAPSARCSVTAVEVPPTTAYVVALEANGLARRVAPGLALHRTQDLPHLAVPTGAAYATPLDRLQRGEPLVAEPMAVVLVPPERAIDIDDATDLARARRAAPTALR